MEEIMNQTSSNKKAIEKNRKRICKIESDIKTNESLIFQSRSMIEENRLMILSNYTAAFLGNRQLAKTNTDEVFENRELILEKIDPNNEVETNFVSIHKNKAKLDHLTHNSEINSKVLEVSKEMSEINLKLVSINTKIMELNQSIVDFNTQQIETNKLAICQT